MAIRKSVPREKLVSDYIETPGASLAKLCRDYGVARATLKRMLREAGIEVIPERQWGHREADHPLLRDKQWIQEQLKEKTVGQIAKEFGIHRKTLHDQIRRHNIEYPEAVWKRMGSNAANWKGGRRTSGGGHIYIYQPDHPRATKEGYVMEHRLVVEKNIGRFLTADEAVHHRNGIKTDNRIENLEVMTKEEHRRHHLQASAKVHELEQENERLKAEIERLRQA